MRLFSPVSVCLILMCISPLLAHSLTSTLLSKLFGSRSPEDLVKTTAKSIIVPTTTNRLPDTTTEKPVFYETIEVPNHEEICGILPNTFHSNKKVVGGYDSPRGFHPYIASIRKENYGQWGHNCGATLIHPRFLLSAAHCFKEPIRSYRIVLGARDKSGVEGTQQRPRIKDVHIHPLYEDYREHDIAIIELEEAVQLNDHVSLACLPSRNFNYYPGRLCVVQGWGRMKPYSSSTRIQAGLVPIIDRETCKQTSWKYHLLSSSSFCAGYFGEGISTCHGDSGGPLACQESDGAYTVVGITSWGIDCAEANNPIVFTRVLDYLDWIYGILEYKKVVVERRDD